MPAAKEFMVTDLIVLSPEMRVHDAMKLFLANDISGAPVVDEHGGLVGILTERDCLQVIYRTSYYRDPGGTVQQHMSAPVQTLDEDQELISVIERFIESRYRRFPVLSGTRLVGLISRRDILRSVVQLW